MIDPDFLALLRCPETRQTLAVGAPEILEGLRGRLPARASGVLVRADGTVAYPILDGIPTLLVDAAIRL